ncbi:NADPH:quinone reductase-like Zn-dependent oxidoreductase [Hephaestia caeni]|uniref:NADPH:quinone reductase-like Zn-dependent oxidoreductase n=1 Tax=Hephaestia caeni TaxID=645617 RepID=A0A397NN00_9SPHN|nr:quinone oxidoreductase [Hephaestia caeni]RIA36627.1 NADPH:quinone reductase-like Zn-dependent oxidoreductase [Hephaestia caeni]
MARVVRIEHTGGPEVMQWVDIDLPAPAPGEVRIRTTAVGLNFIDIYHRRGDYPLPLPTGLGSESVGVVEAVGPGVTGLAEGDRVATFGPERGAYATHRNLPAEHLSTLPDTVDDASAAALMLKGSTAQFLIERCAKVERGQTVLVHAAAGGVGQLLAGWLNAIGAIVIGTVGNPAKAVRARKAGAAHVIDRSREDVVARVREITGGKRCPVIFDGVGRATWEQSLDCAARRGLIVSFGSASGPVDGVALGTLASKGSLFVTRPTLFDYVVTRDERQQVIDRVFAMLAGGAITAGIGRTFRLEDIAQAHRALEAGATEGATVLLP